MASRDHRRQATGTPPGRTGAAAGATGTPHVSRRQLLAVGAGAGAAATAVVALVPAARAQTPGTTGGTTPGSAPSGAGGAAPASTATVTGADLEFVRFARSVELALAGAYDRALDTGKLKSAATDQARAFRAHHDDHAARFVDFAEAEVPNTPNRALLAALTTRVDGAVAERDLIAVLEDTENRAAATYLFALGEIDDWLLASVAATIAPVDAQHATAWNRLAAADLAEWVGRVDDALPVTQGVEGRFDAAQYPVGPS